MIKKSLIITFYFLIFALAGNATTRKIEISQLNSLDPFLNENTLLLIDLDHTILRSSTSLGSIPWIFELYEREKNKGYNRLEIIEKLYPLWMEIQRVTVVELVEDDTADWIKKIQSQSIPVIVVTSRQPKMADITLRQVKDLRLNFAMHPFINSKLEFLSQFPVLFEKGILMTNEQQLKTEILEQFLRQLMSAGFEWEKVIFVDDDKKTVDHFVEMADKMDIPALAVRYSACDSFCENYNHEIAEKQFEFFRQGIPDEFAKKILKTPEGRQFLKHYQDPLTFMTRSDLSLNVNTIKEDLKGEIQESFSLEDLLDLGNEKTLIVFDLNDTLMSTRHFLGSDTWADGIVKQNVEKGLSKETIINQLVPLWHQILIATPVKSVEINTAEIFQELQRRNVLLLGLTSRYVEMAYPTLKALKDLGIDFSHQEMSKNDFTISVPFPAKYLEGIIFAGLQNSKKQVLLQFLKQKTLTFEKLVFIDDKKKNAQEMSGLTTEIGKPIISIWYRGGEKQKALDPDIGHLQLLFFHKIVPDFLIPRGDKHK